VRRMTKQLSIAAALVLAVACKTDTPSPASSRPAAGDTATKARSGKIDVKPVQPALPAAAAAGDDKPAAGDSPRGNPAGRDEWRKRRDAKLDANGDGVVSDEERAAAMQQRVTAMRTRLDADGDGKLTPAELANAPGRMHFDNPAALDTNHDGDISADELAAGLKARRDQRRGDRAGADQGTADPSKP
jgi:EF hand